MIDDSRTSGSPEPHVRAELLEAEIRVCSRNGLSGMTTRAITAEAGLPHGAFHYWFDGKADMLRSVLMRSIHDFHERAGEMDSYDDLDHILRALLTAVTNDLPGRQLAMVELTASSIRDKDLSNVAIVSYRAFRELFVEVISEWAAVNALSIDCEVYGRLVAALAEGAIISWLADPDQSRVEEILVIASQMITTAARHPDSRRR